MKRTSINSVLAQIALTIDDRYWNEMTMLEHATRAFRQLNLEDKWEQRTILDTIVDFKFTLPSDLKHLVQIALKTGDSYQPLRLTTSSYANRICIANCNKNCTSCPYEYHISASGVVTTNKQDGEILISYLAYPTDEEGYALIPDDENVKEAIFHYVLYRYWLQKDMMKEEGASSRVQFHLSMWNTLSKKALSLNLPSVGQLDNISNMLNKFYFPTNPFNSMFSNIGSKQFNGF